MTTTISNLNFSAQIKHEGAELFSFKNNTINKEYIWEGNPEFWGKHAPILFPIVGTLKGNTYTYEGTEFKLSRHGFARDQKFDLIHKDQNSALFSLQTSADSLKQYPFDFELQIKYILVENKLNIEYKIVNRGDLQMPFSIGAHPAIALPENFEDYEIQFEKEEPLVYHLLENDLISDRTAVLETKNNLVPLNYILFKDDALIFKGLKSKFLTILQNKSPYLKVAYNDFPHLGIWTKINAPFICIEPWFGYSDTINSSGNLFEKEGIQILEPKKDFNAHFSLEIL